MLFIKKLNRLMIKLNYCKRPNIIVRWTKITLHDLAITKTSTNT